MTDCQHEWEKISIESHPSVFTCLQCGHRLEVYPLTATGIQAEQALRMAAESIPELVGKGPASQDSIAWDYESAYYHIYGLTPLVDDAFDDIFIGMPRSKPADGDVQSIVDALNRMISRKDLGG